MSTHPDLKKKEKDPRRKEKWSSTYCESSSRHDRGRLPQPKYCQVMPDKNQDASNPFYEPHLHEHRSGRSIDQHEPQYAQSQVQLFRSIQASTQMLYDVYDNNIGMIEELEKHETHGKQVQNSGILSHVIPVNHKKPKQDVIAGIELQLKCLEGQMESLPPAVTSEAKKDLIMQTIKWAASREAEGIPYGHVDHYCKNVLEILLFDAPHELPSVDRGPMIKPTPEQVNQAIYQMQVQRHLGDKQDKEFHRDPTKKAKLRKKRQTEDIREGVRRLTSRDRKLAVALDEQGYVHDASMDMT